MKHMVYYATSVAAVSLFAALNAGAATKDSWLEIIDTSSCRMEIVSGAEKYAQLSMVINARETDLISPQHSSCIIPVLVSADGTQSYEFSPVYVDGRTRAKAIDRIEVLSGVERPRGSVVIRQGDTDKTIQYTARIPYSPSMLDGKVVFREVVTGCAGCTEHEDSLVTQTGIRKHIPRWEFTPTGASASKTRSFSARADLKFVINKFDILPDFSGNAEILDDVISTLETASDSSLYSIVGISFTGYASPDGPEGFNRTLAENRARSLAEYAIAHVPGIPADKVSVKSVGEDWEGLFKAAGNDDRIASNRTITRIREMLSEDNWSECEKILKQDSELYDYLREGILASLRRTEYTIDYVIRDFSAEQAERLWRDRPELLSVDEFNAVARLYGEDSPEYLDVLLAAVRTYPDDEAALQTAALALRSAGKGQEAMRLLEGHDSPMLLNTLGILQAESGDYDEARQSLKAAAAAGNPEAGHNIEELSRVVEQH